MAKKRKRSASRKRKRKTTRSHPSRNLDRLACTDDDLRRRPDHVKFIYATYVSEREPGRRKMAQLEKAFQQGPLGMIPEINHWAMEEFLWHGFPNESWHPIEAYLDFVGDRLSEAGREQLRRWKEARIGFYQVGKVRRGTVVLQEWNPVSKSLVGEPFNAITLGMGGAGFFRRYRGHLTLTYMAPWLPAEGIFCLMGYAIMSEKDEAGPFELLLNLRMPELAAEPLPWERSAAAKRKHLKTWKERDWLPWLEERLEFPFRALMLTSPDRSEFKVSQVTGLLPLDTDETRQFGVYVEVPVEGGIHMVGLTNLTPLDISSPNWMPVTEYRAYREQVGPPPGMIGVPGIVRLR
ncbi:MAG: calcium-binding protein [Anaerolineae bacterium]